MFVSHGIWFLRTRDIRRRAKEAGVEFDDFDEAIEWQSKGKDYTFGTLWRRMRKNEECKEEQ